MAKRCGPAQYVLFILLALLLFLAASLMYQLKDANVLWGKTLQSKPIPSPALNNYSGGQAQAAYKKLPNTTQTYVLSYGENTSGPHMTSATFDPQDPGVGEKQKITIKVTHTSPLVSATVRIISDNNKEKTHILKLKEGTLKNGTWEGEVTMTDTHVITYGAYFEIISQKDSWKDTLFFR